MSSSLRLNKLDFLTGPRHEVASSLIGRAIEGRQSHVIPLNPHVYLHGVDNEELAELLKGPDVRIIDGIGIQLGWRFLSGKTGTRLTGTDLMDLLAERASVEGLGVFLLGGEAGSSGLCARALLDRYPALKIRGILEPPRFADIRELPQEAIVEIINASGADILFVAFGAPKQELFLSRNRHALKPRVLMGVGSAFDLHGGGKRRAPYWMRRVGLEWVFRILLEPIRLGRRYGRDIPRFIARMAFEAFDPA